DIRLKQQLETMVRPIRVGSGQIELAFEPGASPGLANELQHKLEAWTGARWMVLVAPDGGERPMAAQARDSRESLFAEARSQPEVKAILARFPGAEIVDVRDPPDPAQTASEEGSEAPS